MTNHKTTAGFVNFFTGFIQSWVKLFNVNRYYSFSQYLNINKAEKSVLTKALNNDDKTDYFSLDWMVTVLFEKHYAVEPRS